jgi:hypothetical protein
MKNIEAIGEFLYRFWVSTFFATGTFFHLAAFYWLMRHP